MRENKIARFLKDIFLFFFLSLTKYQENTNIWDVLVWQNQTFFADARKIRCAKNKMREKKMRENKTHAKIS